MSEFMKICSLETEIFHADGRTDITKLRVAFCDFANASENGKEKPVKRHYHSRENSIYEGWNFNSGNYLFTTDTK